MKLHRSNPAARALLATCATVWLVVGQPPSAADQPSMDQRLEAARQFVDASDKYLHHSHLRRGMKGYGLTVFAGTEIVRFDVEIVSVMANFGPHQDVILARLSGHGLEQTGIIAGMSGSPCYVEHDGRDKLIGAVAYGWTAQKEPLCGIQPITQMLAMAGVGRKAATTSQPSTGPASAAGAASPDRARLIEAVLDPRKADFSRLAMPAMPSSPSDQAPRMVPLATPMAVAGAGGRAISLLGEALGPAGMVPLQAGSMPSEQLQAVEGAAIVPGAAMSVPLVMGDANYSAVGTATEVVGDRVLAFGHAFFAEGQTELPIGPAYINTVVSNLFVSFKLSSDLKVTGVMERDEQVGVAGTLGKIPPMVPMTIHLDWTDLPGQSERHQQGYSYQIVSHRWLTPLMVALITEDVVWQCRLPPEEHTVTHLVQIDFDGLGRYQAGNVTSGRAMSVAVSDATRPLAALLNNPFGQPPKVTRVTIQMHIDKGTLAADIDGLKLDGATYKPGETVTGTLAVTPFRTKRQMLPIRFELPADLPEGAYTLTACDFQKAGADLKHDMPHKFQPRTVEQLFESLKLVVGYRGDSFYLRMPLQRGGGLAMDQKELPDLPGSKAAILRQAQTLDTAAFSAALVRQVPCHYLLSGSASASFQVQKTPRETFVRQ